MKKSITVVLIIMSFLVFCGCHILGDLGPDLRWDVEYRVYGDSANIDINDVTGVDLTSGDYTKSFVTTPVTKKVVIDPYGNTETQFVEPIHMSTSLTVSDMSGAYTIVTAEIWVDGTLRKSAEIVNPFESVTITYETHKLDGE